MAGEMDFKLEWDLPEYPQLPRMFTNAKAAKKRKHREFVMTEADLEQVVKIPRAVTGAAYPKKPQQHEPAAAAAAAAPAIAADISAAKMHKNKQKQGEKQGENRSPSEQPSPAAALTTQQKASKKPGKQSTAAADVAAGRAGREATTSDRAAAKAEKKKRKQEARELAAQAQLQQPDDAGDVAAAAKASNKKRKHKQPQQQDQQLAHEVQQAAAMTPDAAGMGVAASVRAAVPGKSRKNKFKTLEFLQQQQQQQQLDNGQAKQSKQQQQVPVEERQQQQQQQKLAPHQPSSNQKKQPKKQQQQQQQHAKEQPPPSSPQPPAAAAAAAAAPAVKAPAPAGGSKAAAAVQGAAARQQIQLNEALYTQPGEASFSNMQQQPDLFQQYHEGFQQQVKAWPSQPLDAAITWLKAKPEGWVVADFGCGEARLAATVKQAVHSLDLVAAAPGVIACNMAHTPLDTGSCDVAVFSLALMGTDYGGFLVEASRVLKLGGWLWVAEVRSRFADAVSGKEDFRPLLAALKQLGFKLVQQDASNRMFVVWVLQKKAAVKASTAAAIKWPALRACMYKKR